METPLSPLEFLRRARRLYSDREAVVDESLRLTYSEFGRRCDGWSAALQHLGVGKGDRVAYIAPNTHAQLESFYAIPQIGAVLVPINYRLIADDFAYIIGHSGAKVVCVHSDYLEDVERIRQELPEVKHFVALEGLTDPLRKAGWLDYETVLADASETCCQAMHDARFSLCGAASGPRRFRHARRWCHESPANGRRPRARISVGCTARQLGRGRRRR